MSTVSARDARAASRASAAEERASVPDAPEPVDPEVRREITEAFGVDLLRTTAPCGGQDSPAQSGERKICVEEDRNREQEIRQNLFGVVSQLHNRVSGFDNGIAEGERSPQHSSPATSASSGNPRSQRC